MDPEVNKEGCKDPQAFNRSASAQSKSIPNFGQN